MSVDPRGPMELSSTRAPARVPTDEPRAPLLPATPDIADGDAARLNLIGESPAFQQCVRQIRRMAAWSKMAVSMVAQLRSRSAISRHMFLQPGLWKRLVSH